jgi:hypothetical protein
VQGVAVTATNGTTTLTATTTSAGCVLFANVTPGSNWTVTATKSGYIDNSDDWNTTTNSAAELTSGSTPVTVVADETLTEQWYYDQSTVNPSYSVTLAGSSPWLPTNLSALPLTFYSSYFPVGVNSYTAQSPALVYPYNVSVNPPPSYYVVAGSCGAESAPDGANLTGAAKDGQAVSLSSGSTATPVFPLTPIDLVVQHNGTAVNGATVTASVSSSDGNCATGNLAMPTLGLGQTCVPGVACAVNAAYHRPNHSRKRHYVLVSCFYSCSSTSTSLSSTLSNSSSDPYGTSVTLTATVTCSGGGYYGCGTVNSGTVTFYDSGTSIGSSSVNSSGVASLTTATLAVGNNGITATYGGSGSWGSSTSSNLPQKIYAAPTTTTLTSNPNPSSYGTSAILTATVTANSPSTATPTGTVGFTSNGTTISGCGSVSLNGSGQATCTLSGAGNGTYSLVATYSPSSSNFVSSTSSTVNQVVGAATTTTTVTSSTGGSSNLGAAVTFTATVTASSGTPTGTVSFTANGSAIAGCTSVTLNSGSATCTTSALAAGSDAISAAFTSSNTNSFANSSGSMTQYVYSVSTSPSILSGLPYGVWVLTITDAYGTTSAYTLTVTPSGVQLNGGAVQAAGSLMVVAD